MIVQVDLMVLIYLSAYASFLTLLILFARQDFKKGLKKFFLTKLGRQPIAIRYFSSNLNVDEHIVATRGVGDKIDLYATKWFGLKKTKTGSTFFLDERFARRRDDGLNELSYSYKSVSPTIPDADEAKEENSKIKLSTEKAMNEFDSSDKEDSQFEPVALDANTLYTDPKRINRFIELVKTAAKAEALEAAGADVLKWVKWSTFAGLGALVVGVLIWYGMDSQLYPMLDQLSREIADVGRGLIEV